jgi:phage anti-repressor protein/predicted GIY-YIG superfamily endonuclease
MNNKSLDIVALIENNSITFNTLTGGSSEKLVSKIKDMFTSYEQQLFVASFYCYATQDNDKFVVNFDDVWKWCGFDKKFNAKRLLENHFKENIDYTTEKLAPPIGGARLVEENNEKHGGHNKEIVLLTVDTFKKFCMKAGTKKSDEIHDYYIKLEKILHSVIKENNIEMYEKLKESQKLLEMVISKKEKSLIDNFTGKSVVYIGFAEPGIIKFGFSNDISVRVPQHKREIGPQFTLEYVVETIYNREVEQLIKNQFSRIERTYNNKKQTELIQLTDSLTLEKFYNAVVVIKNSVNNELTAKLVQKNREQEQELEKLKLKIEKLELEKTTAPEIISLEKEKIELKKEEINIKKEDNEIRKNYVDMEMKKHNVSVEMTKKTIRSNEARYQIYDPDTLKLVKTFECINEMLKDMIFRAGNPQNITLNYKSNKAYKGYRIWRLERSEEVKEYKIPDTVKVKRSPRYELVVQLDKDKKVILGLFSCTDEAARNLAEKNNCIKNFTKIKKAITNNISLNGAAKGYYWHWYSDTSPELLSEYLKTHDKPKVKLNKGQRKIYKFNEDKTINIIYDSVTEAIKTEKMSDTTMKNAINSKKIFRNFYWSFEPEFTT